MKLFTLNARPRTLTQLRAVNQLVRQTYPHAKRLPFSFIGLSTDEVPFRKLIKQLIAVTKEVEAQVRDVLPFDHATPPKQVGFYPNAWMEGKNVWCDMSYCPSCRHGFLNQRELEATGCGYCHHSFVD
jgi:hypothetical protein